MGELRPNEETAGFSGLLPLEFRPENCERPRPRASPVRIEPERGSDGELPRHPGIPAEVGRCAEQVNPRSKGLRCDIAQRRLFTAADDYFL